MNAPAGISIVVPTYSREAILIATIEALREVSRELSEIIIVDQTAVHDPATVRCLNLAVKCGWLRWIQLRQPSIPRAMNVGLLAAESEVVLFLDDDIVPSASLINAHLCAYERSDVWAVAGQVLQPDEKVVAGAGNYSTEGFARYLDFPFNSDDSQYVENAMAGNMSVRRAAAIAVGGFDEHFVGAAYRFETEFCRRLSRQGGRIRYEPSASIRHLRAPEGGVRSHGLHRCSVRPRHGVGDYYFVLREGLSGEAFRYAAARPFKEVCSHFHLRRPWCIPIKLVGEFLACFWALLLFSRGNRRLQTTATGE